MTNQVNGDYDYKNERVKKYLEQVKNRVSDLQVKFFQIPKEKNENADRLAKAASAKYILIPSQVLSFVHTSPLIDIINVQEIGPRNYWTTPITSYIKDSMLPDDKEAARKLKVQTARFVLIKDVPYKRGFFGPYLRCLIPEEADYVMREVHGGIGRKHFGSRSLVHKLIWAGYYWSTMQKDAIAYVKTCCKCQRFANLIQWPLEEFTPMTAPWPFAQWGLDIMGPFSMEIQQLKFLVVGIDYITKWVEAKALATIKEKNVRSFEWTNIVYRYGIPRVLVSNNGKQFDNYTFRDFCSQLRIKNHYSSPTHPQANGQVEVTN